MRQRREIINGLIVAGVAAAMSAGATTWAQSQVNEAQLNSVRENVTHLVARVDAIYDYLLEGDK
jgi:hypothetical protein